MSAPFIFGKGKDYCKGFLIRIWICRWVCAFLSHKIPLKKKQILSWINVNMSTRTDHFPFTLLSLPVSLSLPLSLSTPLPPTSTLISLTDFPNKQSPGPNKDLTNKHSQCIGNCVFNVRLWAQGSRQMLRNKHFFSVRAICFSMICWTYDLLATKHHAILSVWESSWQTAAQSWCLLWFLLWSWASGTGTVADKQWHGRGVYYDFCKWSWVPQG